MSFKIGDRIVFINEGLWLTNKRINYGTVVEHSKPHVFAILLDGKFNCIEFSYYPVSNEICLEEVYNSKLYKALR